MTSQVQNPSDVSGTMKVETNGVNPVSDNERYGSPAGLFPIWFSWNVSILGITYGIYVYSLGLSLWQAIVAGVVGYFYPARWWGFWLLAGHAPGCLP